eukprot:346146_1
MACNLLFYWRDHHITYFWMYWGVLGVDDTLFCHLYPVHIHIKYHQYKTSVELTSFDTDITTVPMQVIDEVTEEKEIEYDDVTGIDDVSMDVDQTYQHPKPTPDQTRRHLDILNRNDSDFFKSKEYLDLIPTDSNWINRTPALKNATQKQHEDMLNSFVIPDAPFAYKR